MWKWRKRGARESLRERKMPPKGHWSVIRVRIDQSIWIWRYTWHRKGMGTWISSKNIIFNRNIDFGFVAYTFVRVESSFGGGGCYYFTTNRTCGACSWGWEWRRVMVVVWTTSQCQQKIRQTGTNVNAKSQNAAPVSSSTRVLI